jgi:hypothetical protein
VCHTFCLPYLFCTILEINSDCFNSINNPISVIMKCGFISLTGTITEFFRRADQIIRHLSKACMCGVNFNLKHCNTDTGYSYGACLNAGQLGNSQRASGMSCDRSTGSRFSVVFLHPTANAVLVLKFHFKLHASHAALAILTSKFRP